MLLSMEFNALFYITAKKHPKEPLKWFPQMLYNHLHLRLEQILAVLVVPHCLEFLLHGRALPYPAAEVARGGVLRDVGEIHHRQFVLLVGAQTECLIRLLCLSVCHISLMLCFLSM